MDFLYVSAPLSRYTVGRDKGCDLVLCEPSVSRLHLEFLPQTPDVAHLTVCGSNGAAINGIHVHKGYSCLVRTGDRISVGARDFVWIGDRYEKTEYIASHSRKALPCPGTVNIEAPPPRKQPERASVMLAAGPALTMAIPMLLGASRAVAALSSVFAAVWAIANVLGRVRKGRIDERRRRSAYMLYLTECEKRIKNGIRSYVEELDKYYPPIRSIFTDTGALHMLWSGADNEDGIVTVRAGVGQTENPLQISTPREKFAQLDDSLRELPYELAKKYKYLQASPVTIGITPGTVFGVGLENEKDRQIFASILIRIAAAYDPDRLGIIMETKINTMRYYMWATILPHYHSRQVLADDDRAYLFVTDDARYAFDGASKGHMVMLCCDNEPPAGCVPLFGRCRNVKYDLLPQKLCWSYAARMSELWNRDAKEEIPDFVPFGMLFDGIFSQNEGHYAENIAANYESNDITRKICATLGMEEDGRKLVLDLHEKAAGSHGLVAGTTGSGKSELLTSLILALALEYPPDKAAFFLIDYKGGGMSNLFAGLPHLLGSISNLSRQESKRAGISLKSENLRRQEIFAQNHVNNINDYTRLYDEGKVTEPLPHIFIIVDEFAELRKEEPDFMDRLISISQVGRSLGMHLILATQKPAGVVDDRIRANSGFRIALRLVDRADSMDMLRRDDAVTINVCGRAYLQVGNDEIFTCFQSGYAMCSITEGRMKPHIYEDFLMDKEIMHEDEDNSTVTWLDTALHSITEAVNITKCKIPRRLYMPQLPCQIKDDSAFAVFDNPYLQSYEKAVFDKGNTIIIGRGGSGKSGLVHTILERLREPASVYIIDFGGGMLRDFEKYQCCGGYISDDNVDDIMRLMLFLEELVAGRRRKAENDDNYRIVLAVDGYTGIESASEDFRESLQRILTGGRAYVTVIVTAHDILPEKLMRCFDTFLFLGNVDPYVVSQYLKAPPGDIPVIEDIPGRGVGALNGTPLEFQAVKDAEHPGKSPPLHIAGKYPHVPKNPTLEELLGKADALPVPIGYEKKSGKLYSIPFGMIRCVLIFGRGYSGKGTLLSNLSITAVKYGISCVNAQSYEGYISACKYSTGKTLVVVNITKMMEDFYSKARSNAEEEELGAYLANPLIRGAGEHMLLTVGTIDNDIRIHAGRRVYEELTRHIYGLSLGGRLEENRIFDFSYIPYSQMQKSQKRGFATVLKFDENLFYGDILFPVEI